MRTLRRRWVLFAGLAVLALLLFAPRGWRSLEERRRAARDRAAAQSAAAQEERSAAARNDETDPANAWPPKVPPLKNHRPPPQAANPLDHMAKGITGTPPGTAAPYVMRDKNSSAFFTSQGVMLTAVGRPAPGSGPAEKKAYAVRWGLQDARAVEPRPDGERTEKVNQYLGDKSKWTTEQKSYTSIVYDDIRPGIDLIVESQPQALKYTLQVAAGADVSNLVFRYEGAHNVAIGEGGKSVEALTEIGQYREDNLVAWQNGPEGKRNVEVHYAPAGENRYAIVVGEYDPEQPLTIDPTIGWSGFQGGANSPQGEDDGTAIAADSSGNVYVTGYTYCIDFPTFPVPPSGGVPISASLKGTIDGFLVKLNSSGVVQWATYIGGSSYDYCYGVTVDGAGIPYVVGYTGSYDFPVTGGAYKTVASGYEAFVMKFNPTGTVNWSTFLGGSSTDYGYAIAVDGTGVYVGGITYSTNFPIVNGFKGVAGPTPECFVAKLNLTGNGLLWSTYLGGNNSEYLQAIAVDSTGAVYATGYTYSTDFPATFPLDTTLTGGEDAFVTKISNTGSSILWSTYLGGSSSDYAYGICVATDGTNEPIVVGYTFSSDFYVTLGSYDTIYNSVETFVVRYKFDGSGIVYSTFLGGTSSDYGQAVSPGPLGSVYVTGYTYSSDFPTTLGAYRTTWVGLPDGFVTRINATGTMLDYSTYLGGSSSDYPHSIAVVGANVYVAGTTYSAPPPAASDFPTPIPASRPDPSLGGQLDAFATKLSNTLNSVPWSTYVGGNFSPGDEYGYAIAIDPAHPDTMFVAGTTTSSDFPGMTGPYADFGLGGIQDGYVSRVVTSGGVATISWQTYIGGSQYEYIYGMCVDNTGWPYITGYTTSSDFPLWNPTDSTFSGSEAFVVNFVGTTGQVYYSTYLGGSSSDYGRAIAVDGSYNAYVTGYTYSSNFEAAVLATFKPFISATPDGFIAKLNVSGALQWWSYLGGSDTDIPYGIAVDSAGTACYITGYTYSTDFVNPAVGPDFTIGVAPDAFVTAVSGGGGLLWSRYLGGNSSDYGEAIAVDLAGTAVYVTGYTYSSDFPISTTIKPTMTGAPEAFVTRLAPGSGNVVWSTFLGGYSTDIGLGVCTDNASPPNVFVTGYTYSPDFQIKGAFQPTIAGGADIFVTKIYGSGSAIAWSSFLGGSSTDVAYGISVDAAGVVYVTGYTTSPDFPYLNGLDNSLGGFQDAFVVRLDNANPDLPDFSPVGTGQFKMDNTSLAVGAWTNDPTTFLAKAKVTDSDDENVKLQVEIRPIVVAFDETTATFYDSPFVASGQIATSVVTMVLGSGSQYHWRARTVDVNGKKSGWVVFGANSDGTPPGTPAARDLGKDTVKPSVTITSPAASTFYTQSSAIGISGTTTELDSTVVSATWSNPSAPFPNPTSGPATIVGNTWSVPSIALAAGAGGNAIVVTATDAAGNSDWSSVTVYRDNSAPSPMTVTSPASDGTITGNSTPTLSGDANDNLPIPPHPALVITWANNRGGSGVGSYNSGSHTWSVTTTALSPGLNSITVTATDAAGNQSSAVRTINYDNVPPTLSVSTPATGAAFIVPPGTFTATGNATDNFTPPGSLTVTWTNLTTLATGTASGLPGWTANNVSVQAGANSIQFKATDSVGLIAAQTITVYGDTTLPSISITSPAANPFFTGANTVDLAGTSSDDIGVASISWTRSPGGGGPPNSGTGTLNSPNSTSSTWTISAIPLDPPDTLQTITVTVTDRAGRTQTASIQVKWDTNAPTVGVVTPTTNPAVTNASSIFIKGTATDSGGGQVVQITCTNVSTGTPFTVNTDNALPTADVGFWNATVNLQLGANDITIVAKDDTGLLTTVNLTVFYDPTAPTIKITGPTTADDYTTGLSSLALSGTAGDNRGVTSVTWTTTGSVATMSGTATGTTGWSIPSVQIQPGVTQTITVTAHDEAGNTTSDTLIVTSDPTKPAILITSPTVADTYVTNGLTVSLGGDASDNLALSAVNWVNATTGANGVASGTTTWNTPSITLTPGPNAITVIALDTAGNIQTDTLTVYYDTAPPGVTITGPTIAGVTLRTNVGNIALEGVASDDVGVSYVTWSNAKTGATGTATGTTSWSEPAIALGDGDNVITVTAYDEVGNPNTDTITVHYDQFAPLIAITSPTPPSYSTTDTPVNLSGTSSDLTGDLVSVDIADIKWFNLTTGGTGAALISPGGGWIAAVPLTSGLNLLQVVATDAAGNATSDSISVTYDPAAPFVTITSPTTALTFSTATAPAILGGTSSDDVGVASITWSTDAAVVTPSGPATATGPLGPLDWSTWTASVPLAPGDNLITITATDTVGRTGTSRITIVYDPTAPTVAITNPTAQALFSTTIAPLALGGAASDNIFVQSVTWINTTTGDNGIASGTGAWYISAIPLIEGLNVVTVTATDGVGNTGTATITVDYDGTAPAVAIDPPPFDPPPAPANSTTTRPFTITGTASDNLALASVTWTNSLGGGGTATPTPALPATSATWSASIYLRTGDNLITVTATDAHGYTATSQVTITFIPENGPPSIALDPAFASGSVSSSTQIITVTGSADDNVGVVSVKFHNQSTGIKGTATLTPVTPLAVTWTVDVPLANGANVIVFTATDDAGNTKTVTLVVNYNSGSDGSPPSISILAPIPVGGIYDTTASPQPVALSALDNIGIASVTWSNDLTGGSGTATPGLGTAWDVSVALAPGANTLTFTAYDPSGNSVSAQLIVNFNNTPDADLPVVSISTPTAPLTVKTAVLDMTGTASDTSGIVTEVVWSNSTTSVTGGADGTDTWAAAVLLQPGSNLIIMKAYDDSGNVSSPVTITVNYSPPAPVVPAGHCGLLGLEGFVAILLVRRRVRSRRR